MEFKVGGQAFELDHDKVREAIKGHRPRVDGRNKHFVQVRNVAWPVKQMLELAAGLDPVTYPTSEAVRVLTRCGFVVQRKDKGN